MKRLRMERKIVVFGSSRVGKSSLIAKLRNNEPHGSGEREKDDKYYPTIETSFEKLILCHGKDIPTLVVDTSGKDEYSTLGPTNAFGIHGYVLIYSVLSKDSFDMIKTLREKILEHEGGGPFHLAIIGNKCDISEDKRKISRQKGEALGKEHGCYFTEASAMPDDKRAIIAFERLIEDIEKGENPNSASSKAGCNMM